MVFLRQGFDKIMTANQTIRAAIGIAQCFDIAQVMLDDLMLLYNAQQINTRLGGHAWYGCTADMKYTQVIICDRIESLFFLLKPLWPPWIIGQ